MNLYAPLPIPEEMNRWDRSAMEDYGMPPVMLMENAAREALYVLRSLIALTSGLPVIVFMGGGNNGGDGAAVARLLHEEECEVLVCHTAPLNSLKGAAADHAAMAQKCGVRFLAPGKSGAFSLPKSHAAPRLVVDALAGTGVKGRLRDDAQKTVAAINALGEKAFVFALDIPSGLDGITGKPLPTAVKADATVTFEAGKPGLFVPEAGPYTGTVHVRPIGIPAAVKKRHSSSWQLLSPEPGPWAKPPAGLHKGRAGRVLVIGGSEGMPGAPRLSCLGALRAGVGLVRLACPSALESEVRFGMPEIMTNPAGSGTLWDEDAVPEVLAALDAMRPDAVVLGPGMGRNEGARHVLCAVLERKGRCPAVIDADALFFLKDRMELLQKRDILTPHPGEMTRLLPDAFFDAPQEGKNSHNASSPARQKKADESAQAQSASNVQQDRPRALAAFTARHPSVLVLKGAGTLIGQKDMPVTLSPWDLPALAVPGSGDVLSGIVAALVASGMKSYDAACLGVHLHARAGAILSAKAPKGHLASDIANAVPLSWKELQPAPERSR